MTQKLPHDAIVDAFRKHLNDIRYDPVTVAHRLDLEDYRVHEMLWDTFIAYIYYQCRRYDSGIVRRDLSEITRVCLLLKEKALDEEIFG